MTRCRSCRRRRSRRRPWYPPPVAIPEPGAPIEAKIEAAILIARELISQNRGRNPVMFCTDAAAQAFTVALPEILLDRRTADLVVARHVAFTISILIGKQGLSETGRRLGRDHTSVRNGYLRYRDLVLTVLQRMETDHG